MKTRKIFAICICTFLLAGCGAALPEIEAEISSFVSEPQIVKKPKTYSEIDFDFAAKNFPKNCEWENFVRVIDGDTILTAKNRVRLIGVDTPEIKHPHKPIEKGGMEASAFTKNFTKNLSKVCLIGDRVGDKFDKYNRKLAYIFSPDGKDLNAQLLKNGFAKGYFGFPFSRKSEFEFYQNEAKKLQINLWQ